MREKRSKAKRNKRFRQFAMFGVLMFLLAAQLCMSQRTAYADGKTSYILEVSTGVADGGCIGFFCVTFQDDAGKEHKEYIFPNDGDYEANRQMFEEKSGDFKVKKNTIKNLGYVYMKWVSSKNNVALDKNSVDYYMIETDYRVKTVKSISFCSDLNAGTSSTWSCNGLKLYQLDENGLKGMKMYGCISGNSYLDFSGTLIAQLGTKDETESKETGKVVLSNTQRDFSFSQDTECFLTPDKDNKKYPLYVFSDDLTNEMSLKSLPRKEAADNQSYLFKLDLADQYGAGIESFFNDSKNKDLVSMSLPEVLDLRVTYKDTEDVKHTVHMPVVTSAIAYAQSKVGADQKIYVEHFAGQGESLVFSGTLPDCQQVESVKLTYGSDAALKESGLSEINEEIPAQNPSEEPWLYPQKYTTERKQRKYKVASDPIAITGFSVYKLNEKDSGKVQITEGEQNGNILQVNIPDDLKPSWYYTAPNVKGVEVKAEKNISMMLEEYKPGAVLKPDTGLQKYLLVIDTYEVATKSSAAQEPNIKISLNYEVSNGQKRQTNTYELKQLAKSYYGFVPDVSQRDCAYSMGVSAGGRLCAILEMKDVKRFTGATFSIEGQNEEWQMSHFSIYLIDNNQFSCRKVKWRTEPKRAFGHLSNVEYYREVNGKDVLDPTGAMFDAPVTLMLKNGQSKSINFDSKEVSEAEALTDWMETEKYSMRYETTLSNLGFYNAKYQYEIKVKVKGNAENSVDDGDSGSKNFFYFQLIFTDGKNETESAVVQANQQLQSDGFLTGSTAVFHINVNRNYGELKAIKIIPDQVSKDADPYDKLNIDNITISRRGSTGIVQSWIVENVGWIGIDYKDSGEESPANEITRPMEEVARVFNVTEGKTECEIQFAITTGSYSNRYVVEGSEQKLSPQFTGAVYATIGYLDSKGRYQTTTLDVVEQMYAYAEKQPTNDTITVQVGNTATKRRVSDPDYMFRENHTDRFTVAFSDISTIYDMELFAVGTQSGVLNIKSISAAVITTKGQVAINSDAEYELTGNQIPMTTNKDAIPSVEIATSTPADIPVSFQKSDDNMITDIQNGTWAYTQTRDPISKNDYLNVIVYPDDTKKDSEGNVEKNEDGIESKEDYSSRTMTVKVRYGDPYGQMMDVGSPKPVQLKYRPAKDGSKKTEDGQCFYAMKIGAQGFEHLISIELKSNASVPLKEAIVQQVRDGKIIESYWCDLSKQDAQNTAKGVGTSVAAKSDGKQVVILQLGSQTKEDTLEEEKKDIAVKLHYRSTGDPSGNQEYASKTVFATDFTTIRKIGPGSTFAFTFNNVSDVEEITGISVSATGRLSIDVERACIGDYQIETLKPVVGDSAQNNAAVQSGADTGTGQNGTTEGTGQNVTAAGTTKENLVGWYNINKPVTVSNGLKTLLVDSSEWKGPDTVTPVYINFVTSTETNAGTNGKIRMTVNYLDSNNKDRTEVFEDIQNSTYEGNYQVGQTAKVRLLLNDCQEISSITLEPYGGELGTKESWSPESMELSYGIGNSDDIKYKLCTFDNEAIYEGSPKTIGVSNVMVEVNYEVNEETFDVINNSESHIVESNTQVKMGYKVHNSNKGVAVKAYRVIDASGGKKARADATSEVIRDMTDNSVTFKAPNNTSGKDMDYEVVFESKENTSKSCTIGFTVQPGKQTLDTNVTINYWIGDTQYTVVNGSDNNSVESGAKIKMEFSVTGSDAEKGFTYTVQSVSGKVKDVKADVMKKEGNDLYFNAPENDTGAEQNYQITVESKAKDGLKCIVIFSVKPAEEKNIELYGTYKYNDGEGLFLCNQSNKLYNVTSGEKITIGYVIYPKSDKGAEVTCTTVEDGKERDVTLTRNEKDPTKFELK
ncbi:MAG: hypothetical protein PUB10_03785, partial [Clostridiales bacterium]|nr:hypothetical protein [Clostridiales bacterium]